MKHLIIIILINNNPSKLVDLNKKAMQRQIDPKLYINLYNRLGGTVVSKKTNKPDEIASIHFQRLWHRQVSNLFFSRCLSLTNLMHDISHTIASDPVYEVLV